MFSILKRPISIKHQPYLVAEMSGNHNQSLDRALAIVEAAARSGADAIKLQTYTADTMTLDCHTADFVINDSKSLWHNRRLYELYQQAHTPWDWHQPILKLAEKLGIHCFSTPFDESAVDFLETLHVPAYKIASFECTHLPLIKKVASTGKPMIISTGMATLAEIDTAVRTAQESGCREIVLLKCTSTYPATPGNSHLVTIPNLRNLMGCEVGLSDHTMGFGVAVAAVALGATVIEKHFTLCRVDGGVDAAFSSEPEEFSVLRTEIDRAWQSLGKVNYGGTPDEQASKVFRQSIYVAEDMRKGDLFTKHNLRIVRPGYGLAPQYYPEIIGRLANEDLKKGVPLRWDLLK